MRHSPDAEPRQQEPATGGAPEHDQELWGHIEPESSRRLLLSAVEAFSARGFHAATTREIGERAGLSAAGVYVYYKSKSDLLYEISRIGHDASLAAVESALEHASADPVERVGSFVFAFAKWHADNHVLARVIQFEFKNLPARQFRKIVAIRNRFEELMRDELRSGIAAGAFQVTISRARHWRFSGCASISRAGTSPLPNTPPRTSARSTRS